VLASRAVSIDAQDARLGHAFGEPLLDALSSVADALKILIPA
jgi:hypothetical protein